MRCLQFPVRCNASNTSLGVHQASSLKMLLIPVVLWLNWQFLAPYVAEGQPNPVDPLLFISHQVPSSPPDDPRYQKGYLDLVFIAYYIIFWSFIRQSITLYICRPVAIWFGIRKEAKLDRFGEQAYAVLYFAFNGFWGFVGGYPTMTLCSTERRLTAYYESVADLVV